VIDYNFCTGIRYRSLSTIYCKHLQTNEELIANIFSRSVIFANWY